MAVHREESLLAAARLVDDATHQLAELVGQAVAGGVRDVDDVGARGEHRLDRLHEVVGVRATRVLGRVLHLVAQRPRIRDHLGASLEHVLARHAQLAVDVHVGDGQHDVDLRVLGFLDRAPHGVDVLTHGTRQRGHRHAANLARDPPARLEIAWRRDREARFDHVDAELFELPCDSQLGVRVQVEAWRLLAVAQSGVEDEYSVRARVFHFSTGSNQVIIERSSRPTCSIWWSASLRRMARNPSLPFEFSSSQRSAKVPSWISCRT